MRVSVTEIKRYIQYKENRFSLIFFSVLLLLCSCKKKVAIDTHKYTNQLIEETSPYLLQHAHNPVNWKPWSTDALSEAKQLDKLVLVSVGYSSCHWCHVMEEETFTDESIAQVMNENFINIKVDREERPDVDQVYMTALQLMKGSGGWPLNVITLPDGKPIYGGTYHTKEEWNNTLQQIVKLYKQNPQKLKDYAENVTAGIQTINLIEPIKQNASLSKAVVQNSIENWRKNWDLIWGGEKTETKFIMPSNLDFLLDYALLEEDNEILDYVENTLEKMALGGLYDHVGGGFFRYSTDRYWKVAHFEKMLYTNAQLLSLYSKAFKVYKKPLFKEVILGTTAFLHREMKNKEGGFYAAMDADTDSEEGKYYTWNEKELRSLLKDDYAIFSEYFGIKKENQLDTKNYVLYRSKTDSTFANEQQISLKNLNDYKNEWIKRLSEAKKQRMVPSIDDKIIISWNALLIKGYTNAYMALGNKEFLEEAEAISGFIQKEGYNEGNLIHSYKKNSKKTNGFIEDYSYLTSAYIDLYSATMNIKYLEKAIQLNRTTEELFKDSSSEMYKFSTNDELISKIVKVNDGVLPSPNSVVAHNKFRLGLLYYDRDLLAKSKKMLTSMLVNIEENASNYSNWNSLLLHSVYPFYEVAIIGEDADSFIKEFDNIYIPNIIIAGAIKESQIPLFKNKYVKDDTYVYVCQEGMCKLPVNKVKDAIEQL
ncbi:thioredoxin domain-containing protein [uncultured Aquimarina sp.]|uniref:thioredoxin domain-containing protein n=1 Tax=uncultured Aquimarina sp. TaxID=575652 RepID=UPI002627A3D3|nr:thioredoxin domain-containing protein [uncultured Aquimarina sp.]